MPKMIEPQHLYVAMAPPIPSWWMDEIPRLPSVTPEETETKRAKMLERECKWRIHYAKQMEHWSKEENL